ncbi:MAG TPA: hypothetical protein PKV62_03360, partial [Oscillospiraceae bacterium]|nr:hypothetical protein [Oscillospiraceae bacterium]
MKNKETREEAGTQKTAEQTAPTPDIQDSAKEEPVSEESAAGTKLQAELEGLKADRDALQKKYDNLNDRYLRTLA